jgi:diguanylate cyclase (GGDEF)-like protein
MHWLLENQIKHFFGDLDSAPATLSDFFDAISESYLKADKDCMVNGHSVDIAAHGFPGKSHPSSAKLNVPQTTDSALENVTNYDVEIGLANHTLSIDLLKQAITNAKPQSTKIAVLVIELDQFTEISEKFGQNIHDELFQIVEERLILCLRENDAVERLNINKFVIILPELTKTAVNPTKSNQSNNGDFNSNLVAIFSRILKSVSAPALLKEQDLHVTCCIGVSLYPQDGDTVDFLIENANAALWGAKQIGKSNFQFYNSEIRVKVVEQMTMQNQLQHALERKEFALHYQPQVDLRTGRIIGLEALLRWNSLEFGVVPPDRFIRLAEETGLIVSIGAWVISNACAQAKSWQDDGIGKIRIAVNLSMRQFAQPDLVEYIASVLAETGIDPECLEIELTESLVMTDVDRSIEVLHRLKSLGLQIAIDDFGTGYSSLSYLNRFPIDVLKIDQSFVSDIEKSEGAAVVNSIISLAHSLGIRVIAEGVETASQCDFLRRNLCDEIQGYLFSEPQIASQIAEMIQENRRLPDDLLRLEKPQPTILLVDDESNIISSLKRLLRTEHFQILTANGGLAGLEVLAQHPVDVIISDQRMPGMTGVEFLGIAKKLYPETVRIVLSGYTELHSVTEAVNEGAIYKFLTKPWNDDQLREHILEAVRRKGMSDENHQLNLEVRTANNDLAIANRKLESLLTMKQQQIIRDEISLDIIREALRHIPLAVIGVDDDNMVVFANDTAQTLFDTCASILGSDVEHLIPDLQRNSYANTAQPSFVELGKTVYQVISKRMGVESQARGKIMILSPLRENA